MKRIPLSARFSGVPRAHALVDDEDHDLLAAYVWSMSTAGDLQYAVRHVGSFPVYMHRDLCGLEPGDGNVVDHINGDGLDNRRANLRVVTHAVNLRNRTSRTFGTSQYRGVYWNTRRQKWYARAKVNYRHVWLGAFDDEHEAGRAVEAFWRSFDSRALDAAQPMEKAA